MEVITKKCSKCKQDKTLDNFCKNKLSKDGLDYKCRGCKRDLQIKRRADNKSKGLTELNRYRTEKGFLAHKYRKQKTKSLERGHIVPNYSLAEFKEWCYNNGFKLLFKNWVDSDYHTDLSPSIDRLVTRLGYVLSNMRLTTWSDNSKYNHYCRTTESNNKKIMSVKLNKLWGTSKFTNLSTNSKFLYLYLTTHNNLSLLGVLSLPLNLISIETGLTLDNLRDSSKELINSGYLQVEKIEGVIYFIVPAHFNTVPKSDSTVMKVTKELQQLPKGLVKRLDKLNINVSRKVVTFNEPSPKQVMDYALSQGYKIDAEAFIGFYRGKAKAYGKEGLWLDGRGKQVKDWKAKLRVVWFKDENKLKTVKGAPKGFESFYINFEGKQVFPESWKNNLPHSKNIAVDKALKREYEKRKAVS